MLSVERRIPSFGEQRRSTGAAWILRALFGLCLLTIFGVANASHAQRLNLFDNRNDIAEETSVDAQRAPRSQAYAQPARSNSAYASNVLEDEANESESYDFGIAPASETTQNERCMQKTFRAPTDKDAALIGAFLLRLLPENLRKQTTWRYNEVENTLTVYGPEKAIEFSENLLKDFSEPLYQAFLASGEEGDFVGVAGVASPALKQNQQAKPASKQTEEKYYDPTKNEVVKVAFEPEGAIVPNRQEYAVAFGAGNDPVNAPVNDAQTTRVWGQSKEIQDAANDENAILDVASYRCKPNVCDRVEIMLLQEFGDNPAIAFSFDRDLGTIVVNTTRQLQREVSSYLATLNIFPDSRPTNAPDLRLATGTITKIDGFNSEETAVERQTRQAFTGSQTSMTAERFANQTGASEIDDVYQPQNRKAEELQDALLQLFGERLQRRDSNPNDPYSKRQVVTYRFVKRQRPEDVQYHMCDVSIDPLHNKVLLNGDPNLCAQMLTLLRAMDQPPLRNGNVRRFIPIRNGDAYKLRQIFEYDSKKNVRTARAFNSRYAVDRAIEQLLEDPQNDQFVRPNASLVARYANFFNDVASRQTLETIDLMGASINKNSVKALQAAYRSIDAIANVNSELKGFNGIRQVAYQEGDGGLADLGSQVSIDQNDYSRNRQPGGVGVVQDFTPTVLSDIDVVVVDNATDAEFERIKQMIEQIEELAKIAEIQTEIYNLQHVDCAMLHGVLTTLYTEMFTTKQGRVVFYALQNPNAILVAGWGQAFKDMKDLIQLFDQPIQEGAGTIHVIRLKYASVDEIAALLTETFISPQTNGTGGFAPRIRAFADVRTNSLVVQASPNDWQQIQDLMLELDVNKSTTTLVTRVFPLKNSLAENIRTTIMNAILPAKQGTLDTSAAKFPILELLSVDESGKKLVESGIMMDVDVVADAYHNQLIVNAPEDCMEFMEKLIELLDVAPKKAQIRFFQVIHGDASQIIQTLQSLLATTDDSNSSMPTLPQADGEETFVPVRFALDTRSNIIIAAAAPKELAIVDALIVALDVKDATERIEEVVQLRNIQALVVAQAIDDYLSQKQMLETTSEVLSTYQLYESQVIVIPESISNSIIVSASPERMENILAMIKTFDQDPPQVVIQVLIAEVTLSNTEEFGIEAGLQDSVSFDRSLVTSTSSGSTGKPGFDIVGGNGPGQNMATTNNKSIAGQVLNNFGMGAASSSLGYGGFVVSANSRSIDVTLRALREKNRLQVLSRPQVTAMDNQQAFILVGQRVPRINGTTTTNYGVQMNTVDTPVGLILLVTPRVTKDGKVVMEIGAEKSNLGNDSDAVPIYSQDGQIIKSQSISTIQAMTAISARDGETVMLGGLLTSTKEKISRGVPYLSDVPVLGWLFRYDQEIVQRKELLIVMTPRIMRSSEDYAETMRREVGKTNVDLDDAMALNGNMGLYDPRTNEGLRTKKTKRLLNQAFNPDKMDSLENIPGYSPATDYAPRPQTQLDSENYYHSSNKSASTMKNETERRAQYSWDLDAEETRRSNIINDETEEDVEYDDLLILNNGFSSNNAPKRSSALVERVAMRESDRQKDGARSERSTPRRSREEQIIDESVAPKQMKKTRSEKSADDRSAKFDDVKRYDTIDTLVRGQVNRAEITRVSDMKENSRFRFLNWSIAK